MDDCAAVLTRKARRGLGGSNPLPSFDAEQAEGTVGRETEGRRHSSAGKSVWLSTRRSRVRHPLVALERSFGVACAKAGEAALQAAWVGSIPTDSTVRRYVGL